MKQRQRAFTVAGLGALLVSLATLLTAVGSLYEKVSAAEKDKEFLWDNAGDAVAEVEKLKERLARVEATCKMGGAPYQTGLIVQGNTFEKPGVANILVREPDEEIARRHGWRP